MAADSKKTWRSEPDESIHGLAGRLFGKLSAEWGMVFEEGEGGGINRGALTRRALIVIQINQASSPKEERPWQNPTALRVSKRWYS
jgi:hypothetical protein